MGIDRETPTSLCKKATSYKSEELFSVFSRIYSIFFKCSNKQRATTADNAVLDIQSIVKIINNPLIPNDTSPIKYPKNLQSQNICDGNYLEDDDNYLTIPTVVVASI